MSQPVITAERLGKQFQLGAVPAPHGSLRDALTARARRWLLRAGDPPATDFWALRDVSFEVRRGEVIGIIGRNGAGKSTLLKILSRITPPTEGRVRLRGRVASLLEVGTGFHPELSGRENVFLNGAILGMSQAEIARKFDEIVAFAGVERFIDTPVKRYSSGMYVRLAFSVAAHLEPEILIVDEVLAVGDVEFQQKCIGKMQDVASTSGRTVLFVSHNMAAVATLCGRGILLDHGSVAFDGAVGDAIAAHTSVASVGPIRVKDATRPRVTSVSVLPESVAEGHLTVRVAFDSPWPMSPPVLGVVVFSQLGLPLFGFNSEMDPSCADIRVQRGVAEFRTRDLPLHPGVYRLDIWLGTRGENHHHVADAALFHLIGPQTLPAGISAATVGSVKVSGSWRVESVAPDPGSHA